MGSGAMSITDNSMSIVDEPNTEIEAETINQIKNMFEKELCFLGGKVIMFRFDSYENKISLHIDSDVFGIIRECFYNFDLEKSTFTLRYVGEGKSKTIKSSNIIDTFLKKILLPVIIKFTKRRAENFYETNIVPLDAKNKEFLFLSDGYYGIRTLSIENLSDETMQLFSQIRFYGATDYITDYTQIKKQFKIYRHHFVGCDSVSKCIKFHKFNDIYKVVIVNYCWLSRLWEYNLQKENLWYSLTQHNHNNASIIFITGDLQTWFSMDNGEVIYKLLYIITDGLCYSPRLSPEFHSNTSFHPIITCLNTSSMKAWNDFLLEGCYDPRLFLLVESFILGGRSDYINYGIQKQDEIKRQKLVTLYKNWPT
jgi:hypothetical protein